MAILCQYVLKISKSEVLSSGMFLDRAEYKIEWLLVFKYRNDCTILHIILSFVQ